MFSVFRKYISNNVQLTDEEFQLIESVSTFRKLRKHQYLLQEGDIWRFNAFVCKGLLRTYQIDDKGLEHVLNFAMENWWTGDRESLSSETPAKFNIDALEDSTVLLINKENFEMICNKIPAFAAMVTGILNRSFIASQNRITAALSHNAEEKYLQFIEKYPDFVLRVPRHMIASYLGITPETLSRIRKQVSRK